MKKVKLEFEKIDDINRLISLLDRFHNQLMEIEYTYCCNGILYSDLGLIGSAHDQLRDEMWRLLSETK